MWTPKRILLLVVGFLFFFGCYQVYYFFLGRYDGLPPLPPEFRPSDDPSAAAAIPIQNDTSYLADVREAFGEKCEEINRRVFQWRTQGLLIATDSWKILPSGRLFFSQVSVAIFQPGKDGGSVREINTLKGDEAEIEFDKPIKHLNELGQRKAVAGEVRGNVVLKNNRKTATPDDDVRLLTPWLKYRDDQHRIWTDAAVRLIDDGYGSVVTATGLDVELAAAGPPADAAQRGKAKAQPTVSGVRRVRLDHDVRMEFPDDGQSNFLAGGARPAAAPTSARPPAPKGLVVIECQGPFLYLVETDRAEFNDRVKVLRKEDVAKAEGPATRFDQLDCEQLLLWFQRGQRGTAAAQPSVPAAAAPPPEAQATPAPRPAGAELSILEARAVGKIVELTSDGDEQVKNLHVTAAEMHYDKVKGQTTLRGGPNLFAEMSGYEMRLLGNLILVHGADGQKQIQEARAIGPGEVRIFPATEPPPASKLPAMVRWQDELIWKMEEGKDQLNFKGICSFEDPERGKLDAQEQMVLWVETLEAPRAGQTLAEDPATPPPTAGPAPTGKNAGKNAGAPLGRKQPSRLVATGEVHLHSRELWIKRTERLSLAFVAGPAEPGAAALTPGGDAVSAARPASPLQPDGDKAPKPPLELTAGWIDARLQKVGPRYELERMRGEGNVHVFQPPTSDVEKATDIRSDRLELSRVGANLHKIDLFGKPAVVQLEKLFLSGPEIHLDQQQNTVEIAGAGTMRVPTKSDFEGKPLDQETDLMLEWGTRMLFDGSIAQFVGNVKAEQQQAKLRAGKLSAELDRKYSLHRRPTGAGQEAPITLASLVGDDGVILERRGEKIGEYQRVRGAQLHFNNQAKELRVNGPGGQFDLLSAQTDHFAAPAGNAAQPTPTAPPDAAQPPPLKLTRILFQRQMEAHQQTGVVKFTGDVEFFHVPTDDVDAKINPNRLPPGALFISCKSLSGQAATPGGGASPKELAAFQALERVRVEAQEFDAACDLLTYDVKKELLTMEGKAGNPLRLNRRLRPGAPPDRINARKLIYNRATNNFIILDTDHIDIRPAGGPIPSRPAAAGRKPPGGP